jgi:serine/threonine protein kinase
MTEPTGRELLYGEVTDAILADLRTGREPDLADLAQRYPELADELDAHTAQLVAVLRCGTGEAAERGVEPPVQLGDFRIIREVARGGMGVVYEAEQLSLRRRVALKVLPFATLLDPLRLRRFRHEAEAAARLHHPHVVPVFAVGCEGGLPYYAMQYIDGNSAAALIGELRRRRGRSVPAPTSEPAHDAPEPAVAVPDTPADHFRAVAQWGAQAAEALDFAHQVGITHRDVKPANLLLDRRGDLWVTDFGLARLHGEAELTATGDAVGTLRYMSPEQVLGVKGVADHRVDVYALGATLYELLTLEPSLPGSEREDLFRRLLGDEPRPPRAIDPAIPVDLETVVLKALRKEPAERYPTAKELADDLGRFLDGQPVLARRPTRRERARRWVGRHAVGLAVAGGVLLIVSLVLVGSTVMTLRAYREAREKAGEAEAQRELARQTVDDMASAGAREWFEFDAKTFPVQEKFLRRALEFHLEFVRHRPTDPAARLGLAQAFRHLADAQHQLGKLTESLDGYGLALAHLAELPQEWDRAEEARLERTFCLINRGIVLKSSGRWPEALAAFDDGIALAGRLVADRPDQTSCREGLVVGLLDRSAIRHEAGDLSAAEADLRQGLAHLDDLLRVRPGHRPYVSQQIRLRSNYADVLRKTDRSGPAEKAMREAVESCRGLVRAAPDHRDYQALLGRSLGNLARLLRDTGRAAAAESAAGEAVAIGAGLAGKFPAVAEYQEGLAWDSLLLGELLGHRRQFPAAEESIRKGIAVLEGMLAANPGDTRARMRLAYARKLAGEAGRAAGRPEAAAADLTEALRLYDELAAAVPQNVTSRTERVDCCLALADATEACGRGPRAAEYLRRAAAGIDGLAEHGSAEAVHRFRRDRYNRLSGSWEVAGNLREALEANRRAVEVAEGLVARHPGVLHYRLTCGMEYGNRVYLLARLDEPADARAWAEKAVRSLGNLAQDHPTVGLYLTEAAHANGALGALLVRLGEPKEAEAPYRQQRRLLEKLAGAPGPAREQLAWLVAYCPLASQRDPAAARVLAERLKSAAEGEPEGRVALAALFNRLGRYQDAAGLLEPLAAQEPEEPIGLWVQLAIARHHLGQKEQAAGWLRRAAAWLRAGRPLTLGPRLLLAEVNDLVGNPEPSLRLNPLPVGEHPVEKK